ncbi:hypothetical protein DWW10_20885 [Bacteroides intestinalis]|uniref:Uncharacterized protein n=1 Tax=Bacteroides intestinalis TaxID=329854 RepID=A0A412XVA8_9BACE|nr:hypothetical protein [Bacteroides intestinalis]RGV49011.1 hypothetical protein DWW10_20885 [Bacteroides intestinalis]
MKKVTVISKTIPTKPRSGNYPVGSTVVRTGGGSGGGNTTVVTGSAALEAEITSNAAKTGHIEAGQVLPKGMTFTQFVKALLFKPTPATLEGRLTTGNDVEYGTSKGQINYTATRHGNGEMTKSFYENDESNKLEFSTEVNGVQTAMRALSGIYTQGETYKATVVYAASEDGSIPETTLNNSITVNVRRRWFAGVVSAIPTTSSQVRALSASGLYAGAGTYKFTIGNYKTFVICIPAGTIKEVSLDRYQYNFMDLDSAATPHKISVEGANGSAAVEYTMYVFTSATTSTETDNFTFKTN